MSHQHTSDLEVARELGKEAVQDHGASVNGMEPDINHRASRQLPPRQVHGSNCRAILIASIIAASVVVAAALAGGLGGYLSYRHPGTSTPATVSAMTTATTMPSTTSIRISTSVATSASASSTFTLSNNDCPSSNKEIYISTMFTSGANGQIPIGAVGGIQFKKQCNVDIGDDQNFAQAPGMTLNSCIDLCAGYNFWNNATDCNAISFTTWGGGWIKYGSHIGTTGTSVHSAVLVAS